MDILQEKPSYSSGRIRNKLAGARSQSCGRAVGSTDISEIPAV